MKMIPTIAAVSVASILALSSAVHADNNYGDDGHRSQSDRNFGSHPVDTPPPGPAQAKGKSDPVTPAPDPSDQHREGKEDCDDDDTSNCN
jgi:hypothetical protein